MDDGGDVVVARRPAAAAAAAAPPLAPEERVKLTPDQINRILVGLPFPTMMTSQLRDRFEQSTKAVLRKHLEEVEILPSRIGCLKAIIWNRFARAMTHAGTPVGLAASSSVGQSNQQLTLDSFHLSGQSNAGAAGLPLLIELITLSSTTPRKKSTVSIHLITKYLSFFSTSHLANAFLAVPIYSLLAKSNAMTVCYLDVAQILADEEVYDGGDVPTQRDFTRLPAFYSQWKSFARMTNGKYELPHRQAISAAKEWHDIAFEKHRIIRGRDGDEKFKISERNLENAKRALENAKTGKMPFLRLRFDPTLLFKYRITLPEIARTLEDLIMFKKSRQVITTVFSSTLTGIVDVYTTSSLSADILIEGASEVAKNIRARKKPVAPSVGGDEAAAAAAASPPSGRGDTGLAVFELEADADAIERMQKGKTRGSVDPAVAKASTRLRKSSKAAAVVATEDSATLPELAEDPAKCSQKQVRAAVNVKTTKPDLLTELTTETALVARRQAKKAAAAAKKAGSSLSVDKKDRTRSYETVAQLEVPIPLPTGATPKEWKIANQVIAARTFKTVKFLVKDDEVVAAEGEDIAVDPAQQEDVADAAGHAAVAGGVGANDDVSVQSDPDNNDASHQSDNGDASSSDSSNTDCTGDAAGIARENGDDVDRSPHRGASAAVVDEDEDAAPDADAPPSDEDAAPDADAPPSDEDAADAPSPAAPAAAAAAPAEAATVHDLLYAVSRSESDELFFTLCFMDCIKQMSVSSHTMFRAFSNSLYSRSVSEADQKTVAVPEIAKRVAMFRFHEVTSRKINTLIRDVTTTTTTAPRLITACDYWLHTALMHTHGITTDMFVDFLRIYFAYVVEKNETPAAAAPAAAAARRRRRPAAPAAAAARSPPPGPAAAGDGERQRRENGFESGDDELNRLVAAGAGAGAGAGVVAAAGAEGEERADDRISDLAVETLSKAIKIKKITAAVADAATAVAEARDADRRAELEKVARDAELALAEAEEARAAVPTVIAEVIAGLTEQKEIDKEDDSLVYNEDRHIRKRSLRINSTFSDKFTVVKIDTYHVKVEFADDYVASANGIKWLTATSKPEDSDVSIEKISSTIRKFEEEFHTKTRNRWKKDCFAFPPQRHDVLIAGTYNFILGVEPRVPNPLQRLINNPMIDQRFTVSNNYHEMASIVGMEATRSALLLELLNAVPIHPIHIELIANTMTHSGKLTPFTTQGSASQRLGPYNDAVVEAVVSAFRRAVNNAVQHPVSSLAAAVMTGTQAQVGTGYNFAVVPSPEWRQVDDVPPIVKNLLTAATTARTDAAAPVDDDDGGGRGARGGRGGRGRGRGEGGGGRGDYVDRTLEALMSAASRPAPRFRARGGPIAGRDGAFTGAAAAARAPLAVRQITAADRAAARGATADRAAARGATVAGAAATAATTSGATDNNPWLVRPAGLPQSGDDEAGYDEAEEDAGGDTGRVSGVAGRAAAAAATDDDDATNARDAGRYPGRAADDGIRRGGEGFDAGTFTGSAAGGGSGYGVVGRGGSSRDWK